MQRQYVRTTWRATHCLYSIALWTIAMRMVAAADRLPSIYVESDGVLHIGDNETDNIRVAGVDIYDLQQQVNMLKAANSLMNQRLDRLDKSRSRDTGVFEQKYKLTASRTVNESWFGRSVSVHGSLLLVGADGEDDNSGSVYVFEKNNVTGVFEEKYKLIANDAVAYERFGSSVSVGGDLLFIGAIYDNDKGTRSGSVYVFEKNSVSGVFEQKHKVTASDAANEALFGSSVSVDGHLLFVGARGDDFKGQSSGSVYVFEKNSSIGVFEQKYKLTASDAATSDRFGSSVSADGDLLFVGAFADDDQGPDSGSVYVFQKNSVSGVFEEKYKLTASDAASDDWFGSSVSVDGDQLVVGAIFDDDKGTDSGSVYVFSRPLY